MSTLIFSGCRFSLIEGGFYQKKENQYFKLGSISTDLLTQNAINEFIEYEEKQKREEDLKKKGFVLGIFYERKF
jgi:hypothetical protein